MKLKKDSWHYKLNSTLDDDFEYKATVNFCSYFWKTLFNLVIVTLGLGFIGLLTFMLTTIWKITLSVVGGVTILVFVVGGIGAYVKTLKDVEPGFFRASWRKFRDKTCHKIEWE